MTRKFIISTFNRYDYSIFRVPTSGLIRVMRFDRPILYFKSYAAAFAYHRLNALFYFSKIHKFRTHEVSK